MKSNMFMSLIFGFSIGLSCGLLLYLPNNLSNKIDQTQPDFQVETIDSINTSVTVGTVVDTVCYESIDTTMVYWPWGREENYYYKYKES